MASDLGLHCMHMSHKKEAMLIWVNDCRCLTSFISRSASLCSNSSPKNLGISGPKVIKLFHVHLTYA